MGLEKLTHVELWCRYRCTVIATLVCYLAFLEARAQFREKYEFQRGINASMEKRGCPLEKCCWNKNFSNEYSSNIADGSCLLGTQEG